MQSKNNEQELKNKVSEEEQQAKKSKAAQRRRLQVEKANRGSQEDAIRKILGLDSDKKKEEKRLKEKKYKKCRLHCHHLFLEGAGASNIYSLKRKGKSSDVLPFFGLFYI